jgi:hypothetical protein
MRNAYRILFGKPEGKRPLGTPKTRRDNIKIYIKEINGEHLDSTHMAQDRDRRRALVNKVMNFLDP